MFLFFVFLQKWSVEKPFLAENKNEYTQDHKGNKMITIITIMIKFIWLLVLLLYFCYYYTSYNSSHFFLLLFFVFFFAGRVGIIAWLEMKSSKFNKDFILIFNLNFNLALHSIRTAFKLILFFDPLPIESRKLSLPRY